MGFRNFKIEGRSDDFFVVLEAYCHYMIKPENQGEVRLFVIRSLEDAQLIQVMNPHMQSPKR